MLDNLNYKSNNYKKNYGYKPLNKEENLQNKKSYNLYYVKSYLFLDISIHYLNTFL